LLRLGDRVLRYDFEMFPADRRAGTAGARVGSGMTCQGQSRSKSVVALFRDKQTADAVTAAPPIVRLFLEEAGFELSAADINGTKDDDGGSDAEMRRALVEQLSAALSNRALKKALARAADESEFDVAAFIAAVVSKEQPTYDEAAPSAPVTPRRPFELRGKGIKSRARPQ